MWFYRSNGLREQVTPAQLKRKLAAQQANFARRGAPLPSQEALRARRQRTIQRAAKAGKTATETRHGLKALTPQQQAAAAAARERQKAQERGLKGEFRRERPIPLGPSLSGHLVYQDERRIHDNLAWGAMAHALLKAARRPGSPVPKDGLGYALLWRASYLQHGELRHLPSSGNLEQLAFGPNPKKGEGWPALIWQRIARQVQGRTLTRPKAGGFGALGVLPPAREEQPAAVAQAATAGKKGRSPTTIISPTRLGAISHLIGKDQPAAGMRTPDEELAIGGQLLELRIELQLVRLV